jgi:hypothetical protein
MCVNIGAKGDGEGTDVLNVHNKQKIFEHRCGVCQTGRMTPSAQSQLRAATSSEKFKPLFLYFLKQKNGHMSPWH